MNIMAHKFATTILSDQRFDLNNCTHQEAFVQAKKLEQERNFAGAIMIYLKLSDDGNKVAQKRIEELLNAGDHIKDAAYNVFYAAANLNGKSKYAPQFLGRMYEKGYEFEGKDNGMSENSYTFEGKNKEKAFNYYKQAKLNGVPEADFSIAAMYEKGSSAVPKDLNSALTHYKNAYKQGVPGAAFRIASLYNEGGLTGGQNLNKALEWYIKGNDQGDLDAKDALLGMSIDGRLNNADAMEIIMAAADAGDHRAITRLAQLTKSDARQY
jgi:TPR repeat protein